MIRRRRVPVSRQCRIGVTTERMKDGKWAVVATVTRATRRAEESVDLPVPAARFDTGPDAERYGIRMARRWIDHNMPRSGPGKPARAGGSRRTRRPAGRRAKTPRPKRAR